MSFDDLPFEIQYQIIISFYPKWWLEVEKVNAFTANPVYKIVASKSLFVGPLFACRSMYKATRAALESKFTGLLDATASSSHVNSIIPNFKVFLPSVTMIVMDNSHAALEMSYIYARKLPALQTIRLKSYVTWPVLGHQLSQVLDSDVADEALMNALRAPELSVEKIKTVARALTNIKFLYEQVFSPEGLGKALVTFNLTENPPRIDSRTPLRLGALGL